MFSDCIQRDGRLKTPKNGPIPIRSVNAYEIRSKPIAIKRIAWCEAACPAIGEGTRSNPGPYPDQTILLRRPACERAHWDRFIRSLRPESVPLPGIQAAI